MKELHGFNELREKLTAAGFKSELDIFRNNLDSCNWYAYRQTALEARLCESSSKPPQIEVKVYSVLSSVNCESVEIGLTGERGGTWYKLMAYGRSPRELMIDLPHIEKSLIAAWNALK
jgi:hypothetical protein